MTCGLPAHQQKDVAAHVHSLSRRAGTKWKSCLVNSYIRQNCRRTACELRRYPPQRRVDRQIHVQATMYGEPEYHGAYAANNSEASTGMHRSPSQCAYQGKFGQASFNTDDQHLVEEANHPSGMPATHVMEAPCAYQGRFGTTPAAKMCEPRHSGELERKGSAYHGHFGQ